MNPQKDYFMPHSVIMGIFTIQMLIKLKYTCQKTTMVNMTALMI